MKFKVERVGWENQNNTVPMVLMDKKLRIKLNVEKEGFVRLVSDGRAVVAVVNIQFKDLIGKDVLTLNKSTALFLGVNEGDLLEVESVDIATAGIIRAGSHINPTNRIRDIL